MFFTFWTPTLVCASLLLPPWGPWPSAKRSCSCSTLLWPCFDCTLHVRGLRGPQSLVATCSQGGIRETTAIAQARDSSVLFVDLSPARFASETGYSSAALPSDMLFLRQGRDSSTSEAHPRILSWTRGLGWSGLMDNARPGTFSIPTSVTTGIPTVTPGIGLRSLWLTFFFLAIPHTSDSVRSLSMSRQRHRFRDGLRLRQNQARRQCFAGRFSSPL